MIVDRPGVTLDCQDRWIQPPRFGGTRQECISSSQCGAHSSGAKHACVNGYCQLNGLGGINVGGPLGVDEGSINIDVDATSYVQDVHIRNCNVRNHYAGYEVKAFDGNDGNDDLRLYTSELRNNYIGSYMYATDDSYMYGNYVHDNIQTGMDFEYNWALELPVNSVIGNGGGQMYFHGDANHTNQWLNIYDSDIESSSMPPYAPNVGNVVVLRPGRHDRRPAGATRSSAICGSRTTTFRATTTCPRSTSIVPTGLRRPCCASTRCPSTDSWVDVRVNDDFYNDPRCWNKGNTCNNGGSTKWGGCSAWPSSSVFTSSPCWY